jgi:aspartyl-tRNA(Asn)/glutamyl-tRNA(Gln) amidotransferase subunit A
VGRVGEDHLVLSAASRIEAELGLTMVPPDQQTRGERA